MYCNWYLDTSHPCMWKVVILCPGQLVHQRWWSVITGYWIISLWQRLTTTEVVDHHIRGTKKNFFTFYWMTDTDFIMKGWPDPCVSICVVWLYSPFKQVACPCHQCDKWNSAIWEKLTVKPLINLFSGHSCKYVWLCLMCQTGGYLRPRRMLFDVEGFRTNTLPINNR